MFRRITFILSVFLLTTGFLKAKLENCADEEFRKNEKFNRNAEYKSVEKTNKEKEADKISFEKAKARCLKKGNENNLGTRVCILQAASKFTLSFKDVKVRDIPQSENNRNYKKFINQSLKRKMSDREYENQYSSCIELKKNNNELFEAKY